MLGKRDIARLRRIFANAWSAETSFFPRTWTRDNPTWGQCAVTAMVIQDFFGGDFLTTRVNGGLHFLNRLPDGQIIDLTFEQFPAGTECGALRVASRQRIRSEATLRRYSLLKSRVKADIETMVHGHGLNG